MLIAFHSLKQEFGLLKISFEKYSVLECFAGGQGSLVISDVLEVLKSIGASFWVYWVLFASNVSCILLHMSYPILKKLSSR